MKAPSGDHPALDGEDEGRRSDARIRRATPSRPTSVRPADTKRLRRRSSGTSRRVARGNAEVRSIAPMVERERVEHGHDAPTSESVGEQLARERALRAISIEEIARATRIPTAALRSLEADDHAALPSAVFVRGFIRAYARVVGLDPEPLVERYDAERGPISPATSIPTLSPERGRRFGLAIAVVVLLILFTLALSIVLRPRHRSVPVELGAAPSASAPIVLAQLPAEDAARREA